MGKISVSWSFFIHLPYAYTLIVRTAGHQLVIVANYNISDPLFVSVVGPGVEPGTDFPQFYSLVSGATDQEIAVHNKIDKAYVMIVPMECLATYIVVIEVPKLD